jgi:hypothetical protein
MPVNQLVEHLGMNVDPLFIPLGEGFWKVLNENEP